MCECVAVLFSRVLPLTSLMGTGAAMVAELVCVLETKARYKK